MMAARAEYYSWQAEFYETAQHTMQALMNGRIGVKKDEYWESGNDLTAAEAPITELEALKVKSDVG